MTENELRAEIERLSLDLHEARETIARLRKERDALREALQLMVDRFGPCQDQYIFSKRSAIDKARAALAQGEV